MISIVIPTMFRKCLNDCVASIDKQTYRDLQVILCPQKGLVNARNKGLEQAKGEIVSFIDDDVVLDPGWTEAIVERFNDEKIGGVTGPTFIPQEFIFNRDLFKFRNKWYDKIVLEGQPESIGKIFKSGGFSLGSNLWICGHGNWSVDYLEACNMSFRKSVLDKIGGFDEEYKGTGDWSEPDLAFRVKKEGYKLIFDSRVYLEHRPSRDGIYASRGNNSFSKAHNFVRWHSRWFKSNWRYTANVQFCNTYWIYKFLTTGKPGWLGGILGGLYGAIKYKHF
jgi:glycosyltransferase involved in cell wall biosynthesis